MLSFHVLSQSALCCSPQLWDSVPPVREGKELLCVCRHTHLLGSCRGGLHVCLHKVTTHLPSQMGQLPDSHGVSLSKGQSVPVLRAGGAKGLAEQTTSYRLLPCSSTRWGPRGPEPLTAPSPNGEVWIDPLLVVSIPKVSSEI